VPDPNPFAGQKDPDDVEPVGLDGPAMPVDPDAGGAA
jgi:hypothetical protein